MKITIVVLVLLGIVAAMSAVLLVKFLPGMLSGVKGADEITVLVAAHAIPAHTELKPEDLEEGTIDLTQEGGYYANRLVYLTDPINVVGKTVNDDISVGQAITKNKIITDPDRAAILRALLPGMRAYPVRLSDDQIVGGLLSPGCFVDVLVTSTTSSSMRGRSGNAKGEAVSKTFLERIKVIAVKGELADASTEEDKNPKRSRGGGWTVTLLVDTAQAEALQLATSRGDISLTLRNPLDELPVDSKGTVWDSSKIGILGGFFDNTLDEEDTEPGEEGRSTSSVEVRRGSNDPTYREVPNAQKNAG